MVQPFTNIPLPTDDIFGHVKDLLFALDGMNHILGAPEVCTIRLLLHLEKMVFTEAQRPFPSLCLADPSTPLVVLTRSRPAAAIALMVLPPVTSLAM